MSGKSWKFGDNITTDHITSGRYTHLRTNLPELAKHVLEDAREDFAINVKMGDFIVAGNNFGAGSSREHAPIVIKIAGVNAILAKSFARIFYRNSMNIGLPAIICDTDQINEGDELELNLQNGIILDKTNGRKIMFKPPPEAMTKILNEGGLVPFIKKYGDLNFTK